MTDRSAQLQTIYDAAVTEATARPTSANISAVERARKALDDYRAGAESGGERYKTQASALEYLQRRWKIEKSKLSKDVQEGRCPRKDGYFSARDLDFYASAAHLDPCTTEAPRREDVDTQIKSETARKLRLHNEEREGMLINRAEEEARDAKLLTAIKSDMTNNATVIVHELINLALPVISSDDERSRILAMAHDLRTFFEDMIDDLFDRYVNFEDEV